MIATALKSPDAQTAASSDSGLSAAGMIAADLGGGGGGGGGDRKR